MKSRISPMFRSIVLAGLLGAAQAGHAQAAEAAPTPPPTSAQQRELSEAVKRLRQFISDEELTLIYDFMSNSAVAALRGGDVEPLPPELEFKLAILRERLYKEGNAVMQNFMDFLHQELDATLKKFELPSLPSLPALPSLPGLGTPTPAEPAPVTPPAKPERG
jgi:hypothetical protein